MGEYLSHVVNEWYPLIEKCGARIVGHWQTVIGEGSELITIYEYRNLAHYEEHQEILRNEEGYRYHMEKAVECVLDSSTKFIRHTELRSIVTEYS